MFILTIYQQLTKNYIELYLLSTKMTNAPKCFSGNVTCMLLWPPLDRPAHMRRSVVVEHWFSEMYSSFFVCCSIMLSMMSSQYPRNKKTETSFTLHLKIWISCTLHCSIMLSLSSQYPRNKKQKLHLNFISKFE